MIKNNQNETPKHVPKWIPATLAIVNTPIALGLLFLILPWMLANGSASEKMILFVYCALVVLYYVVWLLINNKRNHAILWMFSSILWFFSSLLNSLLALFSSFVLLTPAGAILFCWFLFSFIISVVALCIATTMHIYTVRSQKGNV